MNKIYSPLQLDELYQQAVESGTLSWSDLVDRAAQRFVYAFSRLYNVGKRRIHIFAGSGTNGAYALAIARLLQERNCRPEVYLFYKQGRLSEVCEEQRSRIEGSDIPLSEISMEFRPPVFGKDEVIIDGLFDGSLTKELSGGYAMVVRRINDSGLPVVSIELPSGLFAEDNSTNSLESVVRASHTIAFESPALTLLMPESAPFVGQWQVLPIGIDEAHHRSISTRHYLLNEQVLTHSLLKRGVFDQKSDFGSALLIGGVPSRLGSLLLSLRATLRAGVGKVVVWTPASLHIPLQMAQPEVRILASSAEEYTAVPERLSRYSAIAIGTAMQGNVMSEGIFRQLLTTYPKGLIFDGWAIDMLIRNHSLLEVLPRDSVLLLSQRDQVRLFGVNATRLERIESAKALAARLDATIILKGPYTAVCRSSDNVYFNTTGSATLAKAGSGDVLTGLILGFIARGYNNFVGSLLAIYIHGLVSDICAARLSAESVLPSDLVEHIGEAIRQISADD